MALAFSACVLTALFQPSAVHAASAPKFTTPADAIAGAEGAFAKGDFAGFADCFDADGQKQMVQSYVAVLAAMLAEAPNAAAPDLPAGSGPDVKKVKALFAKHGVSDLSKHTGESDDQFADRLAARIKDPRGFMVDAIPVAFADPKGKAPVKGQLKDEKQSGSKATASYVVKQGAQDSMDQDVAFTQANGSWKISKAIMLVFPNE
jgi:hypothetical protein